MIACVMVTGRCSTGLVRQLSDHLKRRTLHVHTVLDEIAALEGVRRAKPSITKPASLFQRPPLKDLWHKHFMQPAFLGKNLRLQLTVERFQKLFREKPIETLVHHLVLDSYSERAGNAALTGEWIVFARQHNVNFYLTLGTHIEGDHEIWKRCQACASEFKELDILRENREPGAAS